MLCGQNQLEDTKWKSGWYRGKVQQYDADSDSQHKLQFKGHTSSTLNATGALQMA